MKKERDTSKLGRKPKAKPAPNSKQKRRPAHRFGELKIPGDARISADAIVRGPDVEGER